MKKLLTLFFIFTSKIIFATCANGLSEVIIHIIPDGYQNEISWDLKDAQGITIASGGFVGDTVCVDSSACATFSIHDSYGDGLLAPGGYWLYLNGVLISSGANYGYGQQKSFNCPPGNFCTDPTMLAFGTHTAMFDDTWYEYTPTINGTYSFSTCSLNTCNTQIWIYTTCPLFPYNEGVQGTYAYNDDNNCGTQATLNVILLANTRYLIRIGDNLDSCSSSIDFDFSFVGPVAGCTDLTACNYNPLASVDDGSCIFFPNPACAGPDLEIDSTIFIQSLSLLTHTAAFCDVDEGCVTGYGTRYVISFTSRINNIGTLDFYIGNSTTQPGMFNLNNCHGHDHYEGYGDYRLFDSNGNIVPAGHKNGFCVIDLCGWGQYTCGNMGISAGCYDAYGAGTQCQWIDITDVPTGDYRVAVIINSKHLPDAFGRYETNYINNATQVCMHITQNPSGPPTYTILPNCTPFVDCTGLPGGNAEMDCDGICNGPGVYGDVAQNTVLDSMDVYTYMDMLQSNIPASNCNDLNRDSSLSVYDAALVNWCRRQNPLHPSGSTHNHCNFPRNILNPTDLVSLAIKNVDFTNHFVDIEVLNTATKVKAYQFTMSGIDISGVVSLADPINFPVDARFISSTNEVIGISLEDSSLDRSASAQQLIRIYFSAVTDTQICISRITDIVNQNAERTTTTIYGTCFASQITTSINPILKDAGLVVIPNPANNRTFLHITGETGNMDEFTVTDITGKVCSVPKELIKESWYELNLEKLPSGIYFIVFRNNNFRGSARFVKM